MTSYNAAKKLINVGYSPVTVISNDKIEVEGIVFTVPKDKTTLYDFAVSVRVAFKNYNLVDGVWLSNSSPVVTTNMTMEFGEIIESTIVSSELVDSNSIETIRAEYESGLFHKTMSWIRNNINTIMGKVV